MATWLLAGRHLANRPLAIPHAWPAPPLSPLSNVYTGLIYSRSVLLGGASELYQPFETSPQRLLVFETSPDGVRKPCCIRTRARPIRYTMVSTADREELTRRMKQTDGVGAYSERTAHLTFTLAYLQTSVSRFLIYTELQQECPCS